MNIGMIVPFFPNIVQTYTLNLITSLIDLGNTVTVIVWKKGELNKLPPAYYKHKLDERSVYLNALSKLLFLKFFDIRQWNFKYVMNIVKLLFNPSAYRYGPAYLLKSLIFVQVLNKSDYDILHSHSFFTSYDYLFLSFIFKIPLVATFHGLTPKTVKPLAAEKQKRLFEEISLFFVNTVFAKKQLIGLGCPEDKIAIIPQGTKVTEFTYNYRPVDPGSKIDLITIGRLSIEKGHLTVLKALKKLIKQYPDIHYHILGSGPERESLEKFTVDNSMEQHVTFHQSVPDNELKRLLADSHIFILPSIDLQDGFHVETQGVVLQEAQSSGCVILASRTGGIPEIIVNNRTGLLFNENDDLELYNQINRLINDQEFCNRLARDAYDDVINNYETLHITKKILNKYQSIQASRTQ